MSETNSGKPSTADCAICRSQTAEQRHVVYEDDHWVLRHSLETNLVGYLVLESRRHFLDMAEAGAAEAASFGVVLKNAVQAIRRVIEVERVYTYTLAEVVPHFHVHIIPRTAAMPRAYRGRGIMSYPQAPAVDPALVEEVCRRLRRQLKTVEKLRR